jgi:transcriptional regulator with XRE-family HTH domain
MAMKNSNSLSGSDAGATELAARRFAKLLESLEKKGISQSDAALRIKLPPQYISDVKQGRRPMTELFARRLAEEFRVDHHWLLGRSGSIELPASGVKALGPAARRLWLPTFSHPVSGEPQLASNWDGTSVELAGVAAAKVLLADRPYVLRFGVDDRRAVLKKQDLVLISQAVDPAAEIQVLKQGTRMFLARREQGTWEPVSTTGTMRGQNATVAGHCLGIIWRML